MNEGLQPRQIFSYLFILAIAVVFTLQFGPGSRGCDAPLRPTTTASAAIVNGKEVSLREFQTAYAQQLSYFRAQGNPLPEAVARQVGIPRQVLDQLINSELLAQEAEREGISPSDAEIRELIHKNPDFKKDDKFDLQHYNQVLRDYYRKTVKEYELQIRRRMAAAELLELVEGSAAVSSDEVKAKFYRDGNKAQLTFVRFNPTSFVDRIGPVKSDELSAYEKSHAREISDYYESNRFLYQKPEEVRARHILIKVEKDAPQATKDEAKKKIEEVRKEIESGMDFALAAKEYSEDEGTKASGGDLGFNPRTAWVPAFAAVAFAAKAGELTQPVLSPFGYHLIQVEEKKPATSRELKEVQPEIAQQLYTKERSKELARAEAEKALAAAKSGKQLKDLYPAADPKTKARASKANPAGGGKLTAVETGPFNSGAEAIPQLGSAPSLVNDVFETREPLLPKVYSIGESLVIAEVTQRERPSEAEFDLQKEALRQQALNAKRIELRDSFLKALKKNATIVTNEDLVGKTTEAG